jgi:hypothetical protein
MTEEVLGYTVDDVVEGAIIAQPTGELILVGGSASLRVTAVQPGTYAGTYRQQGDVFDLATLDDFSDSTVNYGPFSATTQFGWMQQVPENTPLFCAATDQPTPLFPISDPIPPCRTVY